MIENHTIAQVEKENDKRGECPACGRGIMEPCDTCPTSGEECAKTCPDCQTCFAAESGAKCNKCGYISKP